MSRLAGKKIRAISKAFTWNGTMQNHADTKQRLN